MIRWGEIAGVPTHYGRDLVPPLRTEGKPAAFRSTSRFKTKLDECFEELWLESGLGAADVIVSAGALVTKPGMHGKGAAFDLDAIVWRATDQRREVKFYAIDFPKDPIVYCGVGAILNRHFVHTLHYLYNAPHEDHFHIDATSPARFSTQSRSRVGFLQATIHHVHGVALKLDSDWGPRTAAATELALARLGIPGSITSPSVWRDYLLETARLAFSQVTIGGTDDDPDRPAVAEPRNSFTPADDHERPPDEQRRTPRFYVTRPRMRGKVVKRIQRALKDAGADPGPLDSIYGSLTSAAVLAYQRAHDLQEDGIVGPETAGSLGISLFA